MRGARSTAWGVRASLLCGAIAAVLTANPVQSQERAAPSQEIWAGADVTSASWAVYSGMTAALFGPLHANGWRVRAGGGYGEYSYRGLNQKIEGEFTFADALIGYHHQVGALTLKAFAGVAWAQHGLSIFDPENDVTGADFGAKVAIESWLEVTPQMWAQLDLSATTTHDNTYAARGRLGYRITPELSFGPELAGIGGSKLDGWRAGGFARYTWERGEVSASAGLSDSAAGGTGGFGTLNVLYKY